ncbi:MAG TPA: AGE family epimerase/isomerase [Planctomycetota bacterium]|nr:AGE family epimerase/isomerase [Planctomycetota bacterium]
MKAPGMNRGDAPGASQAKSLGRALSALAERCRRELDESVVPFWLRHSLDRECGGYLTGLDRQGAVYDDRKYMWLQGREVWTFSRLYNQWQRREEFLDAARLGADFIRKHGRDEQGRVYCTLTRDGRPLHYQRKPYAAVFTMMGLHEYGLAAGDARCREEAKALFWDIERWISDPALIGRLPRPASAPKVSALADEMVLMSMAMELLAVEDDPRVRQVLADAVARAKLHYDPERRVLMELAALDGTDLRGSPDGRLFNPGHSVEVGWFLLHTLEFRPDEDLRRMALEAIEGSLEAGWDREFGGLLYLMDIEGRPPLQLEHFMKLWWPHTEALYAVALAAKLTGDGKWLPWLERLGDYTWAHFPDPECGEWLGYLDRQGRPTHTCKGGNYKGCFHVPRALLMTAQLLSSGAVRAGCQPPP